ncbi:MAG: endolytic transglycosylase MltG [Oscillospiraceae bacterium]
MSSKEFEDFFKDLEPEDNSPAGDSMEDDEFVFSSFFEDNTSKQQKKEAQFSPRPQEEEKQSRFENDVFAPPPPDEDEESDDFSAEIEEESLTRPEPEPVREEKAPSKTQSSGKKKNRRNTLYNSLVTVIWVSAVLAVSVFIASFALSSINDLVGFSKESREYEIVIPEGATLGEIAGILKDKGVIDEPFAFEVYARVKNMDEKLAAGTYTLNSNLGYDQIFQALRKKDTAKETISLTFYEGMTVTDIAQKLDENGVCDYDEFMAAVDTEVFEYEFESMMGTSEYIYHKWEGYLFPDTYEFYLGTSPRSVMAKFIDNFNSKITAQYYDRMQELGMSLDEVITMASVIQSEAATETDMKLVSSVFHNRLESGSGLPYLQSDVTYFYYRDEIEPYVSDDEELDNAYHTSYDTYYKKGLPVGPICNPGITAIEAALYPENSSYYYFVTDAEGNFYYASTLAEHEANIVKAGRAG